MNGGRRRRVTRGYVWGLIFAVAIAAFAWMLLTWSGISLATGRSPVETPDINLGAAPFAVLLCLGLLVWVLWTQSLLLLRGTRSISLTHMLVGSLGGYLIWCLLGMLVGLSVSETWMSPYAFAIALAWALASLLCWVLLLRRVYTDRPVPRWPWEKAGDLGPDWANTDSDPWGDPDDEQREDEK